VAVLIVDNPSAEPFDVAVDGRSLGTLSAFDIRRWQVEPGGRQIEAARDGAPLEVIEHELAAGVTYLFNPTGKGGYYQVRARYEVLSGATSRSEPIEPESWMVREEDYYFRERLPATMQSSGRLTKLARYFSDASSPEEAAFALAPENRAIYLEGTGALDANFERILQRLLAWDARDLPERALISGLDGWINQSYIREIAEALRPRMKPEYQAPVRELIDTILEQENPDQNSRARFEALLSCLLQVAKPEEIVAIAQAAPEALQSHFVASLQHAPATTLRPVLLALTADGQQGPFFEESGEQLTSEALGDTEFAATLFDQIEPAIGTPAFNSWERALALKTTPELARSTLTRAADLIYRAGDTFQSTIAGKLVQAGAVDWVVENFDRMDPDEGRKLVLHLAGSQEGGEPALLPLYLKGLEIEDPDARMRVLYAIQHKVKDPFARPAFRQAFEERLAVEEEPRVADFMRTLLIQADLDQLEEAGPEEMIAMLADAPGDGAREILVRLTRRRDREAHWEAMVASYSRMTHPGARVEYLRFLDRFAPSDAELRRVLLHATSKDPVPEVRLAALEAVLSGPGRSVRGEALQGLEAPLLEIVASEPDATAREEMKENLAYWRVKRRERDIREDAEAARTVLAILEANPERKRVVRVAVETLARAQVAGVFEQLATGFGSYPPSLQEALVEGFFSRGKKGDQPALYDLYAQALEVDSPDLRARAFDRLYYMAILEANPQATRARSLMEEALASETDEKVQAGMQQDWDKLSKNTGSR